MILIHHLPVLESQAQECLLLNSLIQTLCNGYNSVLSPHLACIAAFIQARKGKTEHSESWDISLLKAYDSLCLELEKLFVLVVNDANDSSVLIIFI